MPNQIEVDYLVVGAGAVGLAFVDTILTETDATVAIVDRHGKPGGHWNDAYPFVQLHQPSAFYGVNSLQLGENRKDEVGHNKGFYELATGSQVSGYFERVMTNHFLPSGRVSYFPMSDYRGDGEFVSLLSGERTEVQIKRKTVDATFYGTTVPSTHTPSFEIAEGVNFIPPNTLPDLWQKPGPRPQRYVILGAGKTAMDAGVWLINSGADPDQISWVTPRDSWLLNRENTQPGSEFFEQTIGCQAGQMQALAEASDLNDLFLRLEACGMLSRIHKDIEPTMYHCATISTGETDILRQIKDVIRLGRVQSIATDRLVLDEGERTFDANSTIYIDCTACAVERREPVPVFQDGLITLQMIRTCQPAFSSALIAYLETLFEDDAKKNQFSAVIPLPDGLSEFLTVTLSNMMNQYQWSQEQAIRQWLRNSRLDGFSAVISGVDKSDPKKAVILEALRNYTPQAIGNIQTLMGQLESA